ncbi:MAG: hypothetical protein DI584_09240 [Stenotrophomonas sp.]|jgi:uncharacterized membrane protein|nr:MAG: hypothetical protein DI584_09240 [Stenotrophomonas sp.]
MRQHQVESHVTVSSIGNDAIKEKTMKQILTLAALVVALSACNGPKPAADSSATTPVPAAPVAAAEAVAAKDDFPVIVQASGTEPFWGVRVDGAKLDYSTPETQASPLHLEGSRALQDGLLVVQGGEGKEAFRLTVQRAECSDGMSDLKHPFTAEFVLGKDTFKGCARDPSVPVEAP